MEEPSCHFYQTSQGEVTQTLCGVDSILYHKLPSPQRDYIIQKTLQLDCSFLRTLTYKTATSAYTPFSDVQLCQFIDELRADIKECRREQGGWKPFLWNFIFSGTDFTPALKKLKSYKEVVILHYLEEGNRKVRFDRLEKSSITETLSQTEKLRLFEKIMSTPQENLPPRIANLSQESISLWSTAKQMETELIQNRLMNMIMRQAQETLLKSQSLPNNGSFTNCAMISFKDQTLTIYQLMPHEEDELEILYFIRLMNNIANQRLFKGWPLTLTWNNVTLTCEKKSPYELSISDEYLSAKDFDTIHELIHDVKERDVMAEDDILFLERYGNDVMEHRLQRDDYKNKLFYSYNDIIQNLRKENKHILKMFQGEL